MADSPSDPVYIIPDSPVCEKAAFGFSPYITTIADLIAYRENKTPLVIGIYGKWGSGKTTLMRSIEQQLKTKPAYKAAPFRRCKPVWFQAWKYKNEDQILAALLEQICNTMAKDDFFTQCRTQIEEIITALKPGKALGELLKNLTGADVSAFFQEMPHKQKLGFYDEFEAFFKRLIWTYLSWRPQKNSFESYDDAKGILTIFIDDLDRCPKGNIVAVLETVKLFMDIPGCVFVIGADNGVIIQALEENYQENAERFMDKIVQVTFNLPRIPDDEFNPYLDKILKSAGQEDDPHLKEYLTQLLPVLDNNPRNFKRFLNDLNLQKGLITNKGLELEPRHLLLWNLIEKGFRACYLALKEEGGYRVLEAVHSVLDQADEKEIDFEDLGKEGSDINIPESVAGFLSDRRLVNILDQFRPEDETQDLNKWLAQFVSLSQVVEAPVQKKKEVIEKRRGLDNGKRVLIEAGTFLYGDDKEEKTIDQDYEMDIYPVTNHQFERFFKSGGYRDKAFWSDEGWNRREKEKWELPRYWENKDFNDPEQPVVGVSWYEAEAYAQWLTAFKNDGHTYRLPTEEEWERAARGEDGRIYPWGDTFDKDKCNSKESNIGKTTRVSSYPNGISPYGCYDMAGNVLEWTSSFYDKDENFYVLRGGAFYDDAELCRCAFRHNDLPSYRNDFFGFRCARIKL